MIEIVFNLGGLWVWVRQTSRIKWFEECWSVWYALLWFVDKMGKIWEKKEHIYIICSVHLWWQIQLWLEWDFLQHVLIVFRARGMIAHVWPHHVLILQNIYVYPKRRNTVHRCCLEIYHDISRATSSTTFYESGPSSRYARWLSCQVGHAQGKKIAIHDDICECVCV